MTSYITAAKTRDMLLKSEHRKAEKNSNKPLNATALLYYNSDYRGQEVSGYWYYHKPGHKKDSC